FASTGDVYAKSEDNNHEDNTAKAPFNIYGVTKLFGEHLVALESHQYPQKNYVVGRIYNLIGPRETNPHIIPEIIQQLKKDSNKLSLGNIWPIRDYVPVDECARAAIALCEKSLPGVSTYNVATGEGQSVAHLIECMQKILGHTIKVEEDPQKVRSVERARLVANVEKLKKHLGWTPTSQVNAILHKLLKSEGFVS
ncbi:MAG: GDP-mannose 4,6-dehydratase, partial [Bdellovibrionaceae bacterium]|nr:GDP-mannose 4,6-dehydratase [Pseudobdellovibrionaceae bacterium]